MRTEAWRGFVSNVRSSSRRLGRVGTQYAKAHPLLVLGGGATLTAFLVSRLRRRPRLSPAESLKRGLIQAAGVWLARAIGVACSMAEDYSCELERKARK